MSKYFTNYCALLASSEQLAYCQNADSFSDFLLRIKTLWGCVQLDDNELLAEINRANQMPVEDATMLAGNWLPYRYQTKYQRVHWLVPVGNATEPFHDEYILRCRQQLLNQIIQPCSSLAAAVRQGTTLVDLQPSGFIFHLSRCGSTLVSGCLSELDSTSVFSESPLLTELLLDNQLPLQEQQIALRALINLQGAAFPGRPHMIVKWNAWDIFRWDLIHSVYPHVPVIFLVRNPVEILASHQKQAGRHMSGDPSLRHFHPVFATLGNFSSVLERKQQVLNALLSSMCRVVNEKVLRVVDYAHLDDRCMRDICSLFQCAPDVLDSIKINSRMQFHSKMPGQSFVKDSEQKQQLFTPEQQAIIQRQSDHYYLLLHQKSCSSPDVQLADRFLLLDEEGGR